MQQLELELGWRYDIFTDKVRPVDRYDMNVYLQTYLAYGEMRAALGKFRGLCYVPMVDEFDRIHSELEKRIRS